MIEPIAFCEVCRKNSAYFVVTKEIKGSLKTKTYRYPGQRAVCSECQSEVYVAEVEENNLKSLYDAYRRDQGIISLEKIHEIPRKYDIGKRPLSLLLGWGELTFTRFDDGDLPSKQYSDVLERIHDSPTEYLALLKANRGSLKSPVAYTKSLRATTILLEGGKSSKSKIDMVVEYLLFHCDDMSPLALQKALYYVQGFFFAFSGRFLFDENCEAWVLGPVYRRVYNRYSDCRYEAIPKPAILNASLFSDIERAVMDGVIQHLCCYSGGILARFTHSEMPWIEARRELPAGTPSHRVIGKDSIGGYFTAVRNKYDMLAPSDIAQYAREMFARGI